MTVDDTAIPLTEEEKKHYVAKAAAGEIPTLEICRRFIATIRKSILSAPKKIEKATKSRTAKSKPDEAQIDFF